MTLSTTINRVTYTGNGVTTAFSFPYRFLANSHLRVSLVSAAGGETVQTLNSDYTVTGAGVSAGGTVTMTTAPTSTQELIIERIVPITQATDLRPNDRFPAETVEQVFDKLTMIDQQLEDRIRVLEENSFGFQRNDDAVPAWAELLSEENRKGKYGFYFNASTGQPELYENLAEGEVLSRSIIGEHLFPQTAYEVTGGVTPDYYYHEEGDIRRYGADAVGDDTAALQDAAAVGIVKVPLEDWGQTAVDITGDVTIRGNGHRSNLDQGFAIPVDENAALLIDLSDVGVRPDGGGGSLLSAATGSAASVELYARDVFAEGSNSLINLPVDGTLTGRINGFYGKDLTSVGVRVGYNDYAESQDWGPFIITNGVVDGINPDDDSSHYGIISYAPMTLISNFITRGIANQQSGDETESVYTKVTHGVVANGVIVDGGYGEGGLNLKGNGKASTTFPQGYNVVAANLAFSWTDAYIAAAPDSTLLTGVNLACDNQILANAAFFNGSGRGIHSASAKIDALSISTVLVADGAYADGAIYMQNAGRGHAIRGATVFAVDGAAVKLRGADVDSTFDVTDLLVENAAQGFIVRPSEEDIADYTLHGAALRNVSAQKIFVDGVVKARKLVLVDVDLDNLLSGTNIGYGDSLSGANRWYVRNLHGRAQTTAAGTSTLLNFRVPTSKPMSFTLRATATDGTNTYYLERRAVYFNAAGTVSLVGAATDAIAINSNAAAWAAQLAVNGTAVAVQIVGIAATTIDWVISVDAETP
jgi:hypothetical protein